MGQGYYASWVSGVHRTFFTPYHIGTFLGCAKSFKVRIAAGSVYEKNMLRRSRVLLFPRRSVPVVWDCIWLDVVRGRGFSSLAADMHMAVVSLQNQTRAPPVSRGDPPVLS